MKFGLFGIITLTAMLVSACDGGGQNNANTGGSGAGETGGGGTGGTSTTGGSGGCPEASDLPVFGSLCDDAIECPYDKDPNCNSEPSATLSCVDGQWHFSTPTTCSPLPAQPACDPSGSWTVATSGPYDPSDWPYDINDPQYGFTVFGLTLTAMPDGFIHIEDYHRGTLSADGCHLTADFSYPESCEEVDGTMFCSQEARRIELDFSTTPVTGTVHMTCTGECFGDATAPVEATKKQ